MPDTRMDFAKKLLADDPNMNDEDLSAALKIYDAHNHAGPEKVRTWLDTAKDIGIGVAKGIGATATNIGGLAANAGMIPGATPSAFNADFRHPALQRAEEATTASNAPQMVGKVLEGAAELALPTGEAVAAIPSATRAGKTFQNVMAAARTVPVNVEAPGQVALRINQLADRGGSMPMAVRKFLNRVTDPEKAAMTYEEARDFASNISRLSANEFQRLTPAVAREVAELRVTLNKSIADAASSVGKGQEYAKAMTEYAKAKKLSGAIDTVIQGAKRGLPYGVGAGAAGATGYWLTKHISSLLGGD